MESATVLITGATLEIPYSKTKGNISYFFCNP